MRKLNEEDFLTLTKEEYCKRYDLADEEYELLVKQYQEM